jgi:hypothetical protein
MTHILMQQKAGQNGGGGKKNLAESNAFPILCPMMNFQHNIWWWQLIP